MPRYEVEQLKLEIIGGGNDTKHITDPATLPAFVNVKEEPNITGGTDGAPDLELKQAKIDPPPARWAPSPTKGRDTREIMATNSKSDQNDQERIYHFMSLLIPASSHVRQGHSPRVVKRGSSQT